MSRRIDLEKNILKWIGTCIYWIVTSSQKCRTTDCRKRYDFQLTRHADESKPKYNIFKSVSVFRTFEISDDRTDVYLNSSLLVEAFPSRTWWDITLTSRTCIWSMKSDAYRNTRDRTRTANSHFVCGGRVRNLVVYREFRRRRENQWHDLSVLYTKIYDTWRCRALTGVV